MLKTITSVIVGGFIVLLSASAFFQADQPLGGIRDVSCSVSSTEVITIGNEATTEVFGGSGNLAYARIQNLSNATNTVHLSFDEGADAVLNEGMVLDDTASSSRSFIEFGLNTLFPYTGAVHAITDNSTTTVLITSCTY